MLIDIDDAASWPADVVALLRYRYPRMRAGPDARPHFEECDALVMEVRRHLIRHSVLAWHCTRLCPDEIEAVRVEGMFPLSSESLRRRELKRSMMAGDELAFSPVDVLGRKRLSHTIAFRRGRYRVRGADGTDLGAFATFVGASRAGLEIRATNTAPSGPPVG